MTFCVAAGIFGSMPFLPHRFAQEVLTIMLTLLFISLFSIKNIWLKLFAVWTIVRTYMFVTNTEYLYFLMRGQNWLEAFAVWHTTPMFVTIMFLVMLDLVARKLTMSRIKMVLDGVCVVVLCHALMICCQYAGLWLLYAPKAIIKAHWALIPIPYTIWGINVFLFPAAGQFGDFGISQTYIAALSGTAGNINIAAALLALGFPAFLRPKWRIFLPILLFASVLMRSMGGLFPTFIVLSIFVWHKAGRFRKIICFSMIIAAVAWVVRFEGMREVSTFGSRGPMWKVYMTEIIPQYWLHGRGVGQSPYMVKIIEKFINSGPNDHWRHPHNEYLAVWLEMGLIGLAIVAGYLATQLARFKRYVRTYDTAFVIFLGVLAGMVNCFFGFTMHVPTGVILMLFLGMMQYVNNIKAEVTE